MRYAGICYDGPKQGQHLVWDRLLYQVAVVPLPLLPVDLDSMPECDLTYTVGLYKWSEPLQKWVWLG